MERSPRFEEWLENELKKRSWQPADLARASGIRDGSLSRILNGTRQAGPRACRAIARALNLSPEFVFRKAGLLPPKPGVAENEDELLNHYRRLHPSYQRLVLAIMRTIADTTPTHQTSAATPDPPRLTFRQVDQLVRSLTPAERRRLLELTDELQRAQDQGATAPTP